MVDFFGEAGVNNNPYIAPGLFPGAPNSLPNSEASNRTPATNRKQSLGNDRSPPGNTAMSPPVTPISLQTSRSTRDIGEAGVSFEKLEPYFMVVNDQSEFRVICLTKDDQGMDL